jgi:hypothetical protein
MNADWWKNISAGRSKSVSHRTGITSNLAGVAKGAQKEAYDAQGRVPTNC